ncbi:glycosyltransferase family 2 protein [Geminicoccus roseus]|uniref:glycosyltransferase family 2 protein n=1 Tax=Geminicoccus roseus TaxID=404900 RepID=UPI000427EA48|nr:glycosyltransferase family 2 protein [Geminicoccus roseus]
MPLVSIVTVCRNAASTLEASLESVAGQRGRAIEHILIDGASSDGTLEILERWRPRLAVVVSEPDQGIADAFNKGIARASGAYVMFVNADDRLGPGQVARAAATLERTGADGVFGDLVCEDLAGRPAHRLQGDAAYAGRIDRGFPAINHPTLLVRRGLFDEIGGFDPTLRIAMDYDWCLRAHRAGARFVHDPCLVGHYRLGGASDRRWIQAAAELRDISMRHGLPGRIAWPLFAGRVAKAGTQRLLSRVLPPAWHASLRRRVNTSHQKVPTHHGS